MTIKNLTVKKALPWILLIGGIIGYLCAFIIMFDKVQLADNPNFKPNCNLNPIISCGNVMQSDQATAFGFPNPFLGLGGFAIVATVGAAMLAGGKFKRWFWLSVNAGMLFAVGFVHWLFFESVYRIQALCPYCMVVWIISITGFWYVTLYNIDEKNIRLPQKLKKPYAWVRRHHLDILVLWFLIIAALILKHFWYYYGRNF
jgi:uncharacterized membrane protein